ncbi:MAG: TonB-dependent receptor [Longimicrobiales bacterium]|nr:TonB-dependent receptor [Longimicrobiales bacterium]
MDRSEYGSTRTRSAGGLARMARAGILALLLSAVAAWPATSQQTGTIAGSVVASGSLAPLASAQLYLVGTGTGGLSNANGRFLLLNVPVGTHQLRVELIGYGSQTREIVVRAGESAEASFQLQTQALGLDEIVVTGTAGAARRREVGNSLTQINLAALDEPIMSTDAILQGRGPGIVVTEQYGGVGGGAKIRLRGNVSAAMSNQPIIYVDGIRVRSEGLPKNVGASGYEGRGPNVVYGPLNDLAPEDIERIEVIKGAAATTLYGTEAAAGVIQIFTKRGKPGAARWTLESEQGAAKLAKFGPTEDFRGRPITVPAFEDEVAPFGVPDDPSYMFIEPYLRTAYRAKYGMSVSGGVQDLSYFISGGYTDEEGVLPDDRSKRFSLRGNFQASPLTNLVLSWNTSYTRTDLSQTAGGPSAHGIILNTFRRANNYVGGKTDEATIRSLLYPNLQLIDRFITGMTAMYTPNSALTTRVTVGYDLLGQSATSIREYGYILAPAGILHANTFENATLTLDAVGTWTTAPVEGVSSALSFGGQSVSTDERRVNAYGENLPGPGDATVSSASTRLGFENKIRVVNAGAFVQELLGYRERYFLTLGLRMDGNSSFGKDLGLQFYPKASFSWVVSDEGFWNESWGEMKVRAAWGQSGRAPGAFDAVRTWNPIGWGGAPAFRPSNLGNPDLGPERTTELEGGIDVSLLDSRLTVGVTYYKQKTTDALFQISQVPSKGFLGSQLENVGALTNNGLELAVNTVLLDRTDWGWELGVNVGTNHSEVLDLGGATDFSIGSYGFISEGQPVPVVRGSCITNPDAFADPVIERNCNYGPNLPTLTLSMNTTVRLPYSMILTARGEYQGGHYAYNVNDGETYSRGVHWPNCFNSYTAIKANDLSTVNALERGRCMPKFALRDFAIYPQDFFKLREVSLAAPLPFDIPGAESARVVLSARNTFRWKKAKYNFADPEGTGGFTNGNTGLDERTQSTGGSIPTPAYYTIAFKVSF